jgi:hypothetical protein
MKSKPPDKSLQTSCKECLFAIYEKDTQTGCVADRINMFRDTPRGDMVIEAYDKEKEFYAIDGLCNYFRPPKWNEGQPDLEKAKKESQTSFTIIIYADDINKKALSSIRKSLADIDYPPDKMSIIISHDIELPTPKKKMVRSLYESAGELGIQTSINAYLHPDIQDYEAFRKAHCSYFIKMSSRDTLPKDMMKEIDSKLNQHAARAVVFRHGNSKAISYYVFLTRFSSCKDYNEFESSVEAESKSVDLYCDLKG